MEQLIHSNESNESKERKLTLSCISEEFCKECDHFPHQQQQQKHKNTNGQFRNVPRAPALCCWLAYGDFFKGENKGRTSNIITAPPSASLLSNLSAGGAAVNN